ncbi:hypothetical protein V8C35DRAFT_288746 [Trichoderma chlorosporum]
MNTSRWATYTHVHTTTACFQNHGAGLDRCHRRQDGCINRKPQALDWPYHEQPECLVWLSKRHPTVSGRLLPYMYLVVSIRAVIALASEFLTTSHFWRWSSVPIASLFICYSSRIWNHGESTCSFASELYPNLRRSRFQSFPIRRRDQQLQTYCMCRRERGQFCLGSVSRNQASIRRMVPTSMTRIYIAVRGKISRDGNVYRARSINVLNKLRTGKSWKR